MLAIEEVFVEGHHVFVGFAFEVLKFVIKISDFFEVHAVAERFDHFEDNVRGAFEHADLGGEIDATNILRGDEGSLAEFVHGFGDFVEGVGKRLDIFAFERSNESGINGGADFLSNSFILPARMGEFVEHGRLIEPFAEFNQGLNAGAGFLRTGFKKREKLVLFAENPLK